MHDIMMCLFSFLFQGKLELITGCSAMTMEIRLLDTEGKFLCILNNEDALLGAYPVDDNMRLHVGISWLCTCYLPARRSV